MRSAQGLPVNMIVLLALVLIVLVVVGAFFISGFGQAAGSIQTVDATEAECQAICNSLQVAGFNYRECTGDDGIINSPKGFEYTTTKDCDSLIGPCWVTLREGSRCQITG